MIILCNHGEVRNKTTFSRIIWGLIALDSCSMYLFTCLLNLGGCKCLGYPWSIYFPFACVWCWQSLNTPSQPLQETRGLPYTAGVTESTATPLIKHMTHLHSSWLVDFGCFSSSAFHFYIHNHVKSILLKQRQLRKYFWWRVLKPPLPLPDFSLCTALWVISAISWDL